ncbi:MAG: hypothetical protein AAF366_04400 [Pseudomonadota bacterium]
MTLRIASDLYPADACERDTFLTAAGVLPRTGCPPGFRGHSAVWARDRDLLVGQAALVELTDDLLRPRLAPPGLSPEIAIGLIDALVVRAEYRDLGLEERMVRHLLGAYLATPHAAPDMLVYAGAARVPVLASVRGKLAPVDDLLR